MSLFRREGQDWCFIVVAWGWRMHSEMWSQCLPRGVMCLQAVTAAPPLSLAHQAMGKPGQVLCPHLPPGRLCHSCTNFPQHPQRLLFAGTSLVIPCPLLKTPHSAVCRCLVLSEPCTWPDPPLGSQSRWDPEVSALVLLIYVAVKALAPDCSVHHPESGWRSISCISFF